MMETPKPNFRGEANRTYIPENSERLSQMFGEQREIVSPIRDEIERAYEAGCAAAYESAKAEAFLAAKELCEARVKLYSGAAWFSKGGGYLAHAAQKCADDIGEMAGLEPGYRSKVLGD